MERQLFCRQVVALLIQPLHRKELLICNSQDAARGCKQCAKACLKPDVFLRAITSEPLERLRPEGSHNISPGASRGTVFARTGLRPLSESWADTVDINIIIYGPRSIGAMEARASPRQGRWGAGAWGPCQTAG